MNLNHLQIAHDYWLRVVQPGDRLLDATCGNGHDSLSLATLLFASGDYSGHLWCLDVQEAAVQATATRLAAALPAVALRRIALLRQCHSTLPSSIEPGSLRLAVYNLGYLPGSDKQLTTGVATTLASLAAASDLLMDGGLLSIMCYPGHEEGSREEAALRTWLAALPPRRWSACWHLFPLGQRAPSLLLLQKRRGGH